jgi:hypothetical protein
MHRVSRKATKVTYRSDGSMVASDMGGGYLRIFEFCGKNMAWASRLITHYTRTGNGVSSPECPRTIKRSIPLSAPSPPRKAQSGGF